MKNKIYSYFLSEFLSIFIVILLTLTFIAWVVQAVNYLEFVTEDGHSFGVYFLYSLLSLPKITAKLLPFVYFVSLFTILLNFEKNNELIIYWCAGINKITFTNQIIKISILFTIFQILFSSILVPYTQDKARSFLRSSDIDMLPSLIKEKEFIDTVEDLTIFVDSSNQDGEMKNIFLKDLSGNKTIFAKKGIINKKKIDIYNQGKMYRDFTYIDDIVDGINALINKAPNMKQLGKIKNDSLSPVAPFRILNIGNTRKVYLLDFINALEKELGTKAIRNYMPMQKGDVKITLSDTTLLKKLTGYNPKTNYKIGIKKFLKWYLSYYNK